jgi:hypothetical protein
MAENGHTAWRLIGHHAGSCNCDWACPCQFNANPTHGYCEAILGWHIDEGTFGDVTLDGVRFGFAVHWPGAIHEGNGVAQPVIGEGASDEQRDAILAISGANTAGRSWRSSLRSSPRSVTRSSPRSSSTSIGRRGAGATRSARSARAGSSRSSTRRSRFRRASRADRPPRRFEYKQAEIGDTVELKVNGDPPLSFSHEHTYAQMYEFEWSSDA